MNNDDLSCGTAGAIHQVCRHASLSSTRVLDVTASVLAMVFMAPLVVAVACALMLEGGGPVFFTQTRIGRAGAPFRIFKFRSMRINGDEILGRHLRSDPAAADEWARDHKLREDPRVTALGSFLRRSSLDELPQFFNVLRGEMSLVGPRPIVSAEAVRYGSRLRAYCSVSPGLTGLWQVSGRNDVSYRRRVAMDSLYARRKCLSLDLWLILATVPAVLRRAGSY